MPRQQKTKPEPRVERSELYQGKVIVEFKPDARKNRYVVYVDGEATKPPSVTVITGTMGKDAALINWAVNNTVDVVRRCIGPGIAYSQDELEKIFEAATKRSARLKKEAADIGTLAHDWCCKYFRGENPALPDKDAAFRPCVDAVLNWAKFHNVQFLYNERTIYSMEHKYAGRLDGIVLVDSVLELLDFKTGGVWPEASFQTAGYNIAIEEELPELRGGIVSRRIVRLRKEDGHFEEKVSPRDRLPRDFGAFLGLRNAYEAAKQIRQEDRDEAASVQKLDWLEELTQ